MKNLIDENHFLKKYKERKRQWKQVAGHKDSFAEGHNEVKIPNWKKNETIIFTILDNNIEKV